MKILGLIPARGGSKGVPQKNVRPLAGKPLIQWAFDCAVCSGVLDRIILSTDDPAVAALAKGIGIEVPFLRPQELARDESPMIDVALHALGAMSQLNYKPDALLLLQPTSPLRKPEHIRSAVRLLGDNDAVCSVVAIPSEYNPHRMMCIREDGYLEYLLPGGDRYTRRQDLPAVYKRDGTIFLTRVSVIFQQRSFYGMKCVPFRLNPDEVLNIDTMANWTEAQRRIGVGHVNELIY